METYRFFARLTFISTNERVEGLPFTNSDCASLEIDDAVVKPLPRRRKGSRSLVPVR